MANLTDKEKEVLNKNVETVNALNKQVLDYSMAQFKACQLKDQAEQTLQSNYEELSNKYNEGNPIQINIESGEWSAVKETEEK
tara:strand:+ start:111 stop:359 length:249 start_codon:yes stop_codon:yes gene_type:complete